MEKYGDPGFKRHTAVARTLGLATLRLADSLVVPLNVTRYAYELDGYLDKVAATAASFNFTNVELEDAKSAITGIKSAASGLDDETADALRLLTDYQAEKPSRRGRRHLRTIMRKLRSINARRIGFEKGFISKEGLPRRPWYKHLGVSPGEYLG